MPEETGGDKSPHQSALEDEAERAEIEFNRTVVTLFNRVYYPTKTGLAPAKLAMTFTGNQLQAEDQILRALADVGTRIGIRTTFSVETVPPTGLATGPVPAGSGPDGPSPLELRPAPAALPPRLPG
jgi:hypothetical protein